MFDYNLYATVRLNTINAINDALIQGDDPRDVIGAESLGNGNMMNDARHKRASQDTKAAILDIAYPTSPI